MTSFDMNIWLSLALYSDTEIQLKKQLFGKKENTYNNHKMLYMNTSVKVTIVSLSGSKML